MTNHLERKKSDVPPKVWVATSRSVDLIIPVVNYHNTFLSLRGSASGGGGAAIAICLIDSSFQGPGPCESCYGSLTAL